ncbi:TetR/AcrR family transcriptional regulator [Ectothiorhodospiraceae bacterium 2226]|nr:TetR/AcrR family transcriptional regulator [Ectothiorhodospiraceae bacterium 2226]
MSARRPTKSAYHHGDLRNALVEAGVALLRAKGPHALSLREVAKQAKVSHAAPYRHFADKHALLAAIAHQGFRRLGAAMAAAEAAHPDDPLRQLEEAGWAYVDLAVRNPEITQLMFGGVLEPERCDAKMLADAQGAFEGLLRIIENGRAAGLLQARDSQELALAAWSLAHGFAMLVAGGQLPPPLVAGDQVDALSRTLCRLLIEGLQRTTRA